MTERKRPEPEVLYGEPLSFWRSCSWWPEGREARVNGGYAGHDFELTVNVEGYEDDEKLPQAVTQVLEALLPDDWKVDDRGTRIEVHPTGTFAGGYTNFDVTLLRACLDAMGLKSHGTPKAALPR